MASVAGTLSVTLTVDYAPLTLGADPVRLRCYNGVLAGPTLRAKPVFQSSSVMIVPSGLNHPMSPDSAPWRGRPTNHRRR